MAQWIKVIDTKPDDWNSTLRLYLVDGEISSVVSDFYMCAKYIHKHTHTQTNIHRDAYIHRL